MLESDRRPWSRVSENVFRVADTCNVYILRSGRAGVAIDFGSGTVIDHLSEFGIDILTDVLITHHHRDQIEGLQRAIDAGVRVWVPPVEQDVFRYADELWQARRLDLDYDVRQDRSGPLRSIAVTGVLPEYATVRFGDHEVTILPTPGHTVGSVSFFCDIDARRLAFTGDLITEPGKVWSLAATQWTYNGIEGVGATWHSALVVREQRTAMLLPSHGAPMHEPDKALDALTANLTRLVAHRGFGMVDLEDWREHPYEAITPHLLQNRTSISKSYVLLSDSGKAMLIDFGYDFSSGSPPAGDRTSRRPLLATIQSLKRDHGVARIDVAVPTHYHDDHVAGFNLLRDVEGTEIWAADNVSGILREPTRFDLPCLWFDPIRVDRSLELGTPVTWEEYELRFFELPGHTLYACAIAFEVDGLRVVATGDQQGTQSGVEPEFLNYTYRNRFRHGDFRRSAELYLHLAPDLLISGHWDPRVVSDAYLRDLLERGRELEQIHGLLLPLETIDLGAEGVAAWIRPYRQSVRPGDTVSLEVEVRNPFKGGRFAEIGLDLPEGWEATPEVGRLAVREGETATQVFMVTVGRDAVRRARIACEVTIEGYRFGRTAEALITVDDRPQDSFGRRVAGRPGQ